MNMLVLIIELHNLCILRLLRHILVLNFLFERRHITPEKHTWMTRYNHLDFVSWIRQG